MQFQSRALLEVTDGKIIVGIWVMWVNVKGIQMDTVDLTIPTHYMNTGVSCLSLERAFSSHNKGLCHCNYL
ncbi:hypothetical protein IMY05_014G0112600 [Salix suchowensis]|nr:hypothetical protein IMY05_014G0112600 [Salix suchowensis]